MSVYNDAQMLIATQIAYLDITPVPGRTVGDFVAMMRPYLEQRKDVGKDHFSSKMNAQLDTIETMLKLADQNGVSGWENWTVVDQCNREKSSGMFGCLIDTGDGNAIVGFRGSESFDGEQVTKDWILADVGLLNNTLTKQQEDAADYIKEVYQKYGNKYDSFSMTGHSLGGNLAEHATITAPDGMRDKIDHTISFDGPGYSDEYIYAHRSDIEKIGDNISHYKWSWVGNLLTQPNGVKSDYVKSHDANKDESDKYDFLGLKPMLWRHATDNVEFSNGSVQVEDDEGRISILAKILGPASRILDYGSDILMLNMFILNPMLGPATAILKEVASLVMQGMNMVYGVVDGISKMASDFVEKFKGFIGDIYQQYFAPHVSGDFAINTSAVNSYNAELKDVAEDMMVFSEAVLDIQRKLRYDSLSGSYLKTKLWFLCADLERDSKKIGICMNTLYEISNVYGSTDMDVAYCFV